MPFDVEFMKVEGKTKVPQVQWIPPQSSGAHTYSPCREADVPSAEYMKRHL